MDEVDLLQAYLLKIAPDISVFSEFEKFAYQDNFQDISGLTFHRDIQDTMMGVPQETRILRGIFMFRDETMEKTVINEFDSYYHSDDKNEKCAFSDSISGVDTQNTTCEFFTFSNGIKDTKYYIVIAHPDSNGINVFYDDTESTLWGVAF